MYKNVDKKEVYKMINPRNRCAAANVHKITQSRFVCSTNGIWKQSGYYCPVGPGWMQGQVV